MDRENVLEKLRVFVEEQFLYMRPDFDLSDTDSLLETGVIDSMGVAEMLHFLEEEFGIVVDERDVTEEQIGSLDAIATYVVSHSDPGATRSNV